MADSMGSAAPTRIAKLSDADFQYIDPDTTETVSWAKLSFQKGIPVDLSTSRIMIPSDGLYRIAVNLKIGSYEDGAQAQVKVIKDPGKVMSTAFTLKRDSNNGGSETVFVQGSFELSEGQILRVVVENDSNADFGLDGFDTTGWFEVEKVR